MIPEELLEKWQREQDDRYTAEDKRRQDLYDDFAKSRKTKAVPKPKQETRECPNSETKPPEK